MAKKTNMGKVIAEIGVGLAAGAAAATGYYFYADKNAKKHRKIAATWATKMKKDVIRQAKSLKNVEAKDFAKIVDTVARTYQGVQSVSATDVKRAAQELKSNWHMIEREAKKTGRTSVAKATAAGKRSLATAKKTVKKVVKKVATKVAAKKTTRKAR